MDMGRITVVHTADLHLGSAIRGAPPSIGGQRRKDLMQTMAGIAETCRQQQADLLLISGDLWDEQYLTRPLVDFVADQFRRIPATSIVIAPGQADPNHPDSFYREYPWPTNVHIFHEEELASIWFPHLNARIYGLAWTGEEAPGIPDWNQIVNSPDSGCQVLIVAYGTPENLGIPRRVLEMENVAYVALGGAHKHVAWSRKVLDPGCPEPLGFSDQGTYGVLLGKVGGPAASLEFLPCNSRQFHLVEVSTNGCMDLQAVVAAVRQKLDPLSPKKNLFQVTLTGTRPQGEWQLGTIADALSEDIFYVRLTDQTDTSYDAAALAAEHSRGVVGRYIAALKGTEAEENIRKRALAFGLDALLSGRVDPC
jgi:DNA repair exonuclease SbcCD nuclease subunit